MSQHVTYEPTATRRPQPDEVVDDSPTAHEPARPSGPAAAVLLAAGLASFTLGLLSVLTAASASVSDALTLSDGVGDISGVTTVSTLVFLSSWGVLTTVWRQNDPPLLRVAAAAGGLIALGLLGTFPPFFNTFGG
jgi:hypothetical protein